MPSKILRFLLGAGILFAAVAVFVALLFSREGPPRRDSAPDLAILVDTVPVERVNTEFSVMSQGTVRPRTRTTVSSEVSGTVIEIADVFVAGGVFDADQVLLRIDPTNFRVALRQAEALVEQRQIEFDGASRLRSQGFRAESEYASAAAALATAKAELTRAQRNLERTEIRLPYRGMVLERSADLGQFVNTGSQLGVTFATGRAEVRLPLTDRDLAFLDLPEPGRIGVDGPSVTLEAERRGRPFEWPATIVRMEGVVDESSRVSYAVAEIEDPYRLDGDGEPLPMGTFVSARIEGRRVEDVLRVPRIALRGQNELMFFDDGRLEMREVDVIRADSEFVYLDGGADAGDAVIVTALESPINGMRVRTADDNGAQSGEISAP